MVPDPQLLEVKTPVIRLSGVEVAYDRDRVLHDIDLEVRQGEILSFIGPNGAGKSTLFKALLGLVPCAAGKIEFSEGYSPSRTGYVPQVAALDRSIPFSVQELLTLNLSGSRWWLGGASQRRAVAAQLEQLHAGHLIDKSLHELSGGELQRVMIAYSLLRHPNLLILDEPSTGVDHAGVHELERLICHLRNQQQLTVLMASHDLHLVQLVSDRVCCLNCHICSLGSADEVMHAHYLKEFYALGGGRFRHGA